MWIIERVLVALVLSGFVGTLVWIAISMLGSADLIAPSACQRIAALSTFAMLMAGAFTTTLVASLLEFPLALAKIAAAFCESRWVAFAGTRIERIGMALEPTPAGAKRRRGPRLAQRPPLGAKPPSAQRRNQAGRKPRDRGGANGAPAR
jgi:hypothetical protein